MTEAGVPTLDSLAIELWADCADLEHLTRLAADPRIKGFTTNPTLMRKAGVLDYEAFAHQALAIAGDRPISFEVFSDDFDEMAQQARTIASWPGNVFVKIPVTDTAGRSAAPLISALAADGINLNVTALTTVEQVEQVGQALDPRTPAYVSVFAGRIADTGRDPMPYMQESLDILSSLPLAQLIWASPRELLNIFQANALGCHVITVTPDVLAKLGLVGKDLSLFSVETVRMFYDDAAAAGFTIAVERPTQAEVV